MRYTVYGAPVAQQQQQQPVYTNPVLMPPMASVPAPGAAYAAAAHAAATTQAVLMPNYASASVLPLHVARPRRRPGLWIVQLICFMIVGWNIYQCYQVPEVWEQVYVCAAARRCVLRARPRPRLRRLTRR